MWKTLPCPSLAQISSSCQSPCARGPWRVEALRLTTCTCRWADLACWTLSWAQQPSAHVFHSSPLPDAVPQGGAPFNIMVSSIMPRGRDHCVQQALDMRTASWEKNPFLGKASDTVLLKHWDPRLKPVTVVLAMVFSNHHLRAGLVHFEFQIDGLAKELYWLGWGK